jgi:hypothetical protein
MQWQRPSSCDSANSCFEVKMLGATVLVRSSSDPTHSLGFTEDEWNVFIAAVKSGEFDL